MPTHGSKAVNVNVRLVTDLKSINFRLKWTLKILKNIKTGKNLKYQL